MRLIKSTDPFWSCQGNTNYLVPFGIVPSLEPSDNYLNFQLSHLFDINATQVINFETGAVVTTTPNITSVNVTIRGVSTFVYLVRIDVANFPSSVKCFYIKTKIGSGINAKFYNSEVYKIYKFDEGDPSLIRFESVYSLWDRLLHDIEKPVYGLTEQYFNYYGRFDDSTYFRNINWFYGDITEGELKFTKTMEGFFNRNTKTVFNETYNLYLKPLPPFHAKELSNVLGGTSLSVWNNKARVDYSLDVTDLTLTPDNKICMVMPTPVKLQVMNSTLYIGC